MHLVPSTVPVYAPFLLCRHQALPLPASLLQQGFATSPKPADAAAAPARPSSSSSASSGESSSGRSTIFAVEIPTADQSPAAAAELALAAASQLQLQLQLPAGALTLVLADDAAASAAAEALQRRPAGGTSAAAMASSAGIKVLGLRQACRSSETLKGVLMLAEPKVADVSGESQFTPPLSLLASGGSDRHVPVVSLAISPSSSAQSLVFKLVLCPCIPFFNDLPHPPGSGRVGGTAAD